MYHQVWLYNFPFPPKSSLVSVLDLFTIPWSKHAAAGAPPFTGPGPPLTVTSHSPRAPRKHTHACTKRQLGMPTWRWTHRREAPDNLIISTCTLRLYTYHGSSQDEHDAASGGPAIGVVTDEPGHDATWNTRSLTHCP